MVTFLIFRKRKISYKLLHKLKRSLLFQAELINLFTSTIYFMNDKTLPYSTQFEIERVRRELENNPSLAIEKALEFYQDYLVLYEEHKELQKEVLVSHLNLYL